jgi:hypothetical protein
LQCCWFGLAFFLCLFVCFFFFFLSLEKVIDVLLFLSCFGYYQCITLSLSQSLCYLEGSWIVDSTALTEPFASDRHFINAATWYASFNVPFSFPLYRLIDIFLLVTLC